MKALTYCLFAVAAFAALPSAHAAGNIGYRCTAANGSVSFQDKPCPDGQQSQSFEYERAAAPEPAASDAAAAEPAAPAPLAQTPPSSPSISATPPPRPPPPTLFRCVRADNDKVYFNETGQTQPYQVPAGVVGLPGSRLGDQVQGSAPESNRPPVAAPNIATAFVTVQDRCEQLTPAEACRGLRSQLEANLEKQRSASKEERPGMQAEANALVDKLAGC